MDGSFIDGIDVFMSGWIALPRGQVIGPLYFSHGPAVLEAVFSSMEQWPAPCPGSLCPLPFLSETIMFQVPDIDMPPQVASQYRLVS